MCEDATKKGESFTSAPKVIFEILSKSTAKFDKGRKYDTYEKFGVLEYNLVEQNGFIVQHKLIDGAYQIVNVYKNNDDYESVVFSDLKIGDYVVHKQYGIGNYVGVNTITADNTTKDYIKIKYAGNFNAVPDDDIVDKELKKLNEQERGDVKRK